jgi:isoamylase
MDDSSHDFAVPPLPDRRWLLFADTSKPSPEDVSDPGEERPVDGDRYTVGGRSVVILTSTEH